MFLLVILLTFVSISLLFSLCRVNKSFAVAFFHSSSSEFEKAALKKSRKKFSVWLHISTTSTVKIACKNAQWKKNKSALAFYVNVFGLRYVTKIYLFVHLINSFVCLVALRCWIEWIFQPAAVDFSYVCIYGFSFSAIAALHVMLYTAFIYLLSRSQCRFADWSWVCFCISHCLSVSLYVCVRLCDVRALIPV